MMLISGLSRRSRPRATMPVCAGRRGRRRDAAALAVDPEPTIGRVKRCIARSTRSLSRCLRHRLLSCLSFSFDGFVDGEVDPEPATGTEKPFVESGSLLSHTVL